MESITNAGIFLIQAVFTIYIAILLIRILSPGLHGEYHNPIAQVIIKLTSPLVLPLRRIIPQHRVFDFGAMAVVMVIEIVHLYIYAWLQTGYWIGFGAVLLWSVGELLHFTVTILFWAIVIDAVLSWIATPQRPFQEPRLLLAHLVSPVMSPLHRWIRPIYGFDFTPVIALLVLKLLDIVLVYPIMQVGIEQAMGT
jgi:YggT family protein